MMRFVSTLRDVSVDIDIPVHFSSMFSGPWSIPEEVFARFMLARWMIPIATDSRDRKIDNVIYDPETNEIASYKPRRRWIFASERQFDDVSTE